MCIESLEAHISHFHAIQYETCRVISMEMLESDELMVVTAFVVRYGVSSGCSIHSVAQTHWIYFKFLREIMNGLII